MALRASPLARPRPLLIAAVGLTHPPRLTFESAHHWQMMHTVLLPVFPLLALGPWLVARRSSRIGGVVVGVLAFVYACFYTSLDVIAGIAAGAYHSLADLQGVSNSFCLGDLTLDRAVDADDLGNLLSAWGPAPDSPADLTRDGVVDGDDLGQMLGAWGPCG